MTAGPDGAVDAGMENSDQFCLYFEELSRIKLGNEKKKRILKDKYKVDRLNNQKADTNVYGR